MVFRFKSTDEGVVERFTRILHNLAIDIIFFHFRKPDMPNHSIPTVSAGQSNNDAPEKEVLPKREFNVQQQKNGEFTWHAFAKANKKITFRGESHPSEGNAIRAIKQELKALGVINPDSIKINILPSLAKGVTAKPKRGKVTAK